ncbi:hypothetical protein Pan44_33020 [Caulifigura coniformis]|uniref:YdhG-like domain-containing protein n=1 Tax=Caulifigura coniformis TaxID=2527983 RepID=A0A517SGK9_9PLAN|nr:DUF1801 domain-containing protein [Caulifigura coniformis]QDT55259.1 hypothetical protein Pan44_33020 [Caulifigura coniformis]
MQSQATTVEQYLAELPMDRRATVETVRKVILKNIDRKQVEEGMLYGMIGYFIPYSVYPPGYHCPPKQPLPYICLASQKNYLSLYMMGLYEGTRVAQEFRDAWKTAGKKLDMGKSCIRFRKADDLALDVIADAIRKTPVASYIAQYESVLNEPKEVRAERRQAAVRKQATKKKAAAAKKRSAR